MRNRIINGAMVIAQRGTSSFSANGDYPVDRFQLFLTQASKLTGQQNAGSVTPPIGFTNYLGITSSSAYSVVSGDILAIRHGIEGFNIADLGWGTANAKTVTLSFWVRSSLTGTFGGSLGNGSSDRSYPFSYTISAANTWEQKTITIAGDTTGTWATNNTGGIYLNIALGVGSTYLGTAGAWAASNLFGATGETNVVGTNGATFYITGVQLEVGTQATSFEYRQYTTELQLCQRYYYLHSSWAAAGNSSAMISLISLYTASDARGIVTFPATMRTSPSLVQTSGSGYYTVYNNGNSSTFNSFAGITTSTPQLTQLLATTSGLTTSGAGWVLCAASGSSVAFSAEL
jgi:hypothetical protein